MKFARSAPAILIGAVVVVVAAVSVISNGISHQMAASFEDTTFVLMGRVIRTKLEDAENKALAAAEIVAATPEVKVAFAARNKEELFNVTKDAYGIQSEKYGISQAQFHLAPAVSFLRVHNPKRPGEDLSHYRRIVVEVNRTTAIRKGIEITTSGIGVFGTLPMTDAAGRHTGSFEMALEFGPLLDELKKTYGFETALYVDEKMLRETATSLKADILNDENRVGRHVSFYSTHKDLLRNLVTGDDVNVTEETGYLRDAAGAPYGVLLQPVYDYAKKQIGVIAVAKDFSDTRSADGRALVWQTLLGVISVTLLTGVILVVVRGVLLQPLKTLSGRIDALADGDVGQEAGDEAAACDEIRRLADSYEKLRVRMAADAAGETSK